MLTEGPVYKKKEPGRGAMRVPLVGSTRHFIVPTVTDLPHASAKYIALQKSALLVTKKNSKP
jgi:hypothetical protein